MWSSRGPALVVALVLLHGVGCNRDETHAGHGIIEQVLAEEQQIIIAHDDIPGLMPAMTMNFSIYDSKLLQSLTAGDVIDFELTASRGQFYITGAHVVGRVDASPGWAVIGDKAVRAEDAPGFSLIDQHGDAMSLMDLRGRVVLLDFIFTRCPGPCPVLTSAHVSAERLLSQELRAQTHFVSISIDPLRDTPDDLAQYGSARGADLSHWSFLTGAPEDVDSVVSAYGIGTTRAEDGEIEHVVASFLIDQQGRIIRRYLGLDHEPGKLVADLAAAVGGG